MEQFTPDLEEFLRQNAAGLKESLERLPELDFELPNLDIVLGRTEKGTKELIDLLRLSPALELFSDRLF